MTIEEAKRAAKTLNNKLISADGNKLIVRPGFSKHQKVGQPIIRSQNDTLNKKQLLAKSVTTNTVAKVTNEASHHHVTDDEDDVWDDGLLPSNVCCNGTHDNKGIENSIATLDLYGDSVSLLEMYVTEVGNACIVYSLVDHVISGDIAWTAMAEGRKYGWA